MKKLSFALAAATLLLASCANDEPLVNGGTGYQDGKVLFDVEMPGAFTRAAADGTKAVDLTYVVFDEGGDYCFQGEFQGVIAKDPNDGKMKAKVQVPLAKDMTYTVAFVAHNADAPYTIADGKLTIDEITLKANDDRYDAFYNAEKFEVKANMAPRTLTLTRPFAQVNFCATDWVDANNVKCPVQETAMTFTADTYTTLNLVDGTVDDLKAMEFAMNGLAEATTSPEFVPAKINVQSNDYDHVGMAYVLAPATSPATVNTVTMTYRNANNNKDGEVAINSVPVARNHRTNIVGRFFTANVEYEIIVDQAFWDYDQNFMQKSMTWDEFVAEKSLDFTKDVVADGMGLVTITDGVDATFAGNLTVRGLTFLAGATFTAKADGQSGKVLVEKSVFYPSEGNSVCLDINTLNSPNLEVEVKDNKMYGEVLTRGLKATRTAGVNGNSFVISGVAKSLNLENNFMSGALCNAIQLVEVSFPVVLMDNVITSWGRSEAEGAKTHLYAAIGGSIAKDGENLLGSLKIFRNSYGLDENVDASDHGVKHIAVDEYGFNTDGKRKGGEFTDGVVPDKDADGYHVNTPEDFMYVMTEFVNNTNAPIVINIENDLDMTGIKYPHSDLGYGGKHPTKHITLNGNGHTISNLHVTGLQATLLPWTASGFTIDGVKMKDCSFISTNANDDYCCAAAFGAFCDYTEFKIENCELENVTVGNGKYVGGFIAYNSSNKESIINNCKVNNCNINSSFTKNGVDYQGHAGALAGRLGNVTITNCEVTNNKFDILGPRGGILVGTSQGVVNATGCKISGNTGLEEGRYIAPGFGTLNFN